MDEDFAFNASVLLGCVIGSATGYRLGGLISAIDWSFFGFAAGAISAMVIAEATYALWAVSDNGARLLDRISPLITLGVLLAVASRFWP